MDLATRRGSVVAQLRAGGADPGLMNELDLVLDSYSERMHKAEGAEALATVLGRLAQLMEQLQPFAAAGVASSERLSKALALLASQPKLMIGLALAAVAVVALAFGANVETLSLAAANILHGGAPCPPL